jgi:hypothetical protein
MHKKTILLTLSFFLSACFSLSNQNDFLFERHKVMGIKTGMKLNDAIKMLSNKYFIRIKIHPNIKSSESTPTDYEVYTNSTMKELLFTFNGGYEQSNNDKVYRIVITNQKLKTVKGLCVGININNVRLKYKITDPNYAPEDGFTINIPELYAVVLLDIDETKLKVDSKNITLDQIPGNSLVKMIALY